MLCFWEKLSPQWWTSCSIYYKDSKNRFSYKKTCTKRLIHLQQCCVHRLNHALLLNTVSNPFESSKLFKTTFRSNASVFFYKENVRLLLTNQVGVKTMHIFFFNYFKLASIFYKNAKYLFKKNPNENRSFFNVFLILIVEKCFYWPFISQFYWDDR